MGMANESPIQIKKTPLLIKYLDLIKQEEAFGNNHTEIARNLLWRGIEDLINRGRIKLIEHDEEV